jgi:hypothetical protein
VSDGVGFAYLADVYVEETLRGQGLGVAPVRFMIDGPGRGFRWTLHTSDAHGLYARFGFAAPNGTYIERQGVHPLQPPDPARVRVRTGERPAVAAEQELRSGMRLDRGPVQPRYPARCLVRHPHRAGRPLESRHRAHLTLLSEPAPPDLSTL